MNNILPIYHEHFLQESPGLHASLSQFRPRTSKICFPENNVIQLLCRLLSYICTLFMFGC